MDGEREVDLSEVYLAGVFMHMCEVDLFRSQLEETTTIPVAARGLRSPGELALN